VVLEYGAFVNTIKTGRRHKIKEWLKRHLVKPERLKGKRIHQILGDRLLDRDIWHITRRSISGGLALGVFIAFTPTIPAQMFLSAVFAIWLRVNLPVAIAACWITNPFTVVWIYFIEYRLGRAVLGNLPGIFAISGPENIGAVRRLFSQAAYIWAGSMIIGAVAALIAYIVIQLAWPLLSRRRGGRDIL